MNGLTYRNGLIAVGLTIVIVATGLGQEKEQTMPTRTQLSWDSPRMREIEEEWRLLQDASQDKTPGGGGKDEWATRVGFINRLIAKRLSKQDVSDLAASCKALPVDPNDWNPFVYDVFMGVVGRLDRNGVVELLSTRCPYGFGDCSLEFALAALGKKAPNKLKDPVMILGEAYAKCQIPEVRRILIWPIRRAFAGHGIEGQDDGKFVKNAMRWYETNKDHLAVNWEYSGREYNGPVVKYQQDDPQYFEREIASGKGQPLFGEKPVSQRLPSRSQETAAAAPKAIPDTLGRADNRINEQELADLQGAWEVVEIADDGTLVPKERIKGAKFVFRKEMLTEFGPDGAKDVVYRIRLGSQQEPQAMDLIRTICKLGPIAGDHPSALDRLLEELNEETTPAIYELNGHILRVCLSSREAAQRPTSFKAEKGSRETSFTLKRVKQ
jgi:uncharacterized protein (TIGR03067 family)